MGAKYQNSIELANPTCFNPAYFPPTLLSSKSSFRACRERLMSRINALKLELEDNKVGVK